MDIWKVALLTLLWTFAISVVYILCNTMLFDIIMPIMDDVAYNARNNVTIAETGRPAGFVDYDTYMQRRTMILNAFNVACFIVMLIPWIYIFVRVLFKKEQTAPIAPQYYQPVGGWG